MDEPEDNYAKWNQLVTEGLHDSTYEMYLKQFNSETEQDGSCQGLGGEENGEFLFSGS